MATLSINTPGNGLVYNTFLNSQLSTPRLCITAETEEFDRDTLRNWQNEGFDIVYVPFNAGGKDYLSRINSVKEGLGVGEQYAIVAFGDAAAFCLEHFRKPTTGSRLTALIAYYPTSIPDTRQRFPPSLKVLVHLAGDEVDVVTTPQALGLQGKRRVATRKIQPGVGTGERLNISYPTFTYEFAEPGFAENDLDEYDHATAELAWTRTLDVLRRAFRKESDLERAWENNTESKFFTHSLSDTMSTYVTHKNPAVTIAPTVKGGVGAKAVRKFYETEFIPALPPSMRMRLLSRTVGADRVVDELHVMFDHTVEMPWMLPGVPPTYKKVEIIIVCIVSLKAERLFTEHMYWDQASVLMQVGLLDRKLVPGGVKGVTSLPVSGREAARRILGEHPARGEEYHQKLVASAKASAANDKPKTIKSEVQKGKGGKSVADKQSKGHSSETTSGVEKKKAPKLTNGPGREPSNKKANGEAKGRNKPALNGDSGSNGLLDQDSETTAQSSNRSAKQNGAKKEQPETDQENHHIARGNGGVKDDEFADDEITDAPGDNHDEKASEHERPSMAARVESGPPEDDE